MHERKQKRQEERERKCLGLSPRQISKESRAVAIEPWSSKYGSLDWQHQSTGTDQKTKALALLRPAE